MPKIQTFLRACYRMMKDYPIIMMTFSIASFWVMKTQQAFSISKSMVNALLENPMMSYRALENVIDASDIEKLLFKVLTLLLAI